VKEAPRPYRIPFNRVHLTGSELAYIAEAVERGHLSGDGAFTRRASTLLEETLGVPRVLLTTSCTHALEMAALLLDLKPGDEVIVPSFAFVTTVNAFVLHGARPVFADVRPDTLNLDERSLPALVTARTRAVVPLHYGGVACEMEPILMTAHRHGLTVVEDNAHGLFATQRGKALGTFGALATQSFHETKNITCGEGGAACFPDEETAQRAEVIREKGTNRSAFLRGQVDKYTWVAEGSSYVLSDLLAAMLDGQLEKLDRIQAGRARVTAAYRQALPAWAERHGVRLPAVDALRDGNDHIFHLLFASEGDRNRAMAALRAEGVMATFHYVPLHSSPHGRSLGQGGAPLPVTESVAGRLLRLPLHPLLSEADVERVIASVLRSL